MLSTKSDPESNYIRGTAGFAPKFAWVSRILAAILICAYVPLGLHAQDPCDAPILAPPVLPASPSSCVSPKPPDNIADGTKSALACAWIDTPAGHDGTDHLLEAFRLLTSAPLPPNVDKKVLVELDAASANNEDLFRAALGNPEKEPTVTGLPDFLDTLAKANTLPKPSDDDKLNYTAALLNCTQDVINDLLEFRAGPIPGPISGPIALAQINDSFGRNNKYLAFYQLLRAVWDQNDAKHLEKLRAAFDTNADDLAKQVAAKIKPAK